MLIAFEGIDGSGKTTTAGLLATALTALGYDAEHIDKRAIAAEDPYVERHLATLSRLIWEDSRDQPIKLLGHDHWVHINAAYHCALHEAIISKAAESGKILVVDGWIYKFAARASVTGGLAAEQVFESMAAVPLPDQVFMLDVDPEEAFGRRTSFHLMEQGAWLGMPQGFVDFQTAVRKSLLKMADRGGWHIERPEGRSATELARDLAQLLHTRTSTTHQPSNQLFGIGQVTYPKPTGLVATIGPATLDRTVLRALIEEGIAGFRIPLARQADRVGELAEYIREESERSGASVDVFLDVPGPKRFLETKTSWRVGDRITARQGLSDGRLDDEKEVLITGVDVANYLSVGDVAYLGDGESKVRVLESGSVGWQIVVERGELAPGRHSITVPGRPSAVLEWPSAYRALVCSLPNVHVLMSFVESPDQVDQLSQSVEPRSGKFWAKVETRLGTARARQVAEASDGVLVGRGDLLLDIGTEDFAPLEAYAIDEVQAAGAPLMVGTQLWTASSALGLPHRSELSWVWHLLMRRVDLLLLSDETTVGRDPVGSVRDLANLARRAAQRTH